MIGDSGVLNIARLSLGHMAGDAIVLSAGMGFLQLRYRMTGATGFFHLDYSICWIAMGIVAGAAP